MSENRDRRRSERRAVDLPCRFKYRGEWNEGRLLNLSDGGAFIESGAVPKPGSEILLTFSGTVKFVMTALITHEGRYLASDRNFVGFGVRFREMPAHCRRKLTECVFAHGSGPTCENRLME